MRTEVSSCARRNHMGLLLIILFLLLVLTGFIIHRWPQKVFNEDLKPSPLPPRRTGLFDTPEQSMKLEDHRLARRSALLARAAEGEQEALIEAHLGGDTVLTREVLEVLVSGAEGSDERLLELTSYIIGHDQLPAHPKIAAALTARWRSSPERTSLAPMLHLAAMTDDAASYQGAVDAATQIWREGRLSNLSADDLSDLLESQYWVLSAEARHSGDGFVLKRMLVDIRRELATARRRTSI
jgi:hypothetical protein